MEKDAQYLYNIIEPIVENKKAIEITRTIDNRGVLLGVRIAKEDMGKVIGKDGETARSIRKLLRQYGMNNNAHVSIKINEPSA